MITHAYLAGLLPSFLAAGGASTCDLVAARQIRDTLGRGKKERWRGGRERGSTSHMHKYLRALALRDFATISNNNAHSEMGRQLCTDQEGGDSQ